MRARKLRRWTRTGGFCSRNRGLAWWVRLRILRRSNRAENNEINGQELKRWLKAYMNRAWRGPFFSAFLDKPADSLHPTGKELVKPFFISDCSTENLEFVVNLDQEERRTNVFGPTSMILSRALSYERPSEANSVSIWETDKEPGRNQKLLMKLWATYVPMRLCCTIVITTLGSLLIICVAT